MTTAIRHCVPEDIPSIVHLHSRNFSVVRFSPEALEAYYHNVFFESPWCNSDFPSLVFLSKTGRVAGFMGVIPRPMVFNGRHITMAVAHRLMVDPDLKSPLASMQLMRAFLAGPQDLSFSDGANDVAAKFWVGMGGSLVYLYSMNWLYPLKPLSYAGQMFCRGRGWNYLSLLTYPVAALLDNVVTRLPKSPFKISRPEVQCHPITVNSLYDCIQNSSTKYTLYPIYSESNIEWMMQFLCRNEHRGDLKGYVVSNHAGKQMGAFLYYLNAKKVVEVLFLAGHASKDEVLQALFYQAASEGAVSLHGRIEPRFLSAFYHHNCIFKRGSWALVHAKDPISFTLFSRVMR